MTLHVYEELEQRSDEWYAARAGIVTASTVGRLLTISAPGADAYQCPDCAAPAYSPCVSLRNATPIKTAHSMRTARSAEMARAAVPIIEVADNDTARALIATLAAERITGKVDDIPMSADMWRGVEDEPLARAHYAEHHAPVDEVGFMVREDNGLRLGYSPDGLVRDNGLVEFKSRLQRKQVEVFLADEVPAVNMAQLQAGLLVSGREWIEYCSFTPGMPMYRKRIEPDDAWHTAITAAVAAAEERITDIVTRYTAAVDGLPVTDDRPDYTEMSI